MLAIDSGVPVALPHLRRERSWVDAGTTGVVDGGADAQSNPQEHRRHATEEFG